MNPSGARAIGTHPTGAAPTGARSRAGRPQGGAGPGGAGASGGLVDAAMRVALRGMPEQLAARVAEHWLSALEALQAEDAELAVVQAREARRLAGRVGAVREVLGVAAYRAGRYRDALAELRAARRMTGHEDLLPLLADCERALGRPEQALSLLAEVDLARLSAEARVEVAIVTSGARRDLGEFAAGVAVLRALLPSGQSEPWAARLYYAYADALLASGERAEARRWFGRARDLDVEGQTDADLRYDELVPDSAAPPRRPAAPDAPGGSAEDPGEGSGEG